MYGDDVMLEILCRVYNTQVLLWRPPLAGAMATSKITRSKPQKFNSGGRNKALACMVWHDMGVEHFEPVVAEQGTHVVPSDLVGRIRAVPAKKGTAAQPTPCSRRKVNIKGYVTVPLLHVKATTKACKHFRIHCLLCGAI
jgi:hypothetical protein